MSEAHSWSGGGELMSGWRFRTEQRFLSADQMGSFTVVRCPSWLKSTTQCVSPGETGLSHHVQVVEGGVGVRILLLNQEEETNPGSNRAMVLSETSHGDVAVRSLSLSNSSFFIKTVHLGLTVIHWEPPHGQSGFLNLSPAPFHSPLIPPSSLILPFLPFWVKFIATVRTGKGWYGIREKKVEKNDHPGLCLLLAQLIMGCNERHFQRFSWVSRALLPVVIRCWGHCRLAPRKWLMTSRWWWCCWSGLHYWDTSLFFRYEIFKASSISGSVGLTECDWECIIQTLFTSETLKEIFF